MQALLMHAPIPGFPWDKHETKQPVVQAFPSQVGGGALQVPPTQVDPPPQSLSAQQAAEQTQELPDFT